MNVFSRIPDLFVLPCHYKQIWDQANVSLNVLLCYFVLQDPVVYSSLSCLRNSTSDLSNTYTTALLAYTFTLAGDMETRAQLLQHLDTISLQEGETYHGPTSFCAVLLSLSIPGQWTQWSNPKSANPPPSGTPDKLNQTPKLFNRTQIQFELRCL